MPEKHALLSASSAKKWLNCPGSARLEAEFEDTTSEAAKEGTHTHAIAELKLRKKFEVMSTRTYNSRMKKLKEDPLYTQEMDHCTDTYLDFVTETAMSYPVVPTVEIEKQVDFSAYAPEGFGTADCIIIGGNTLNIVDYKHGKGVRVEAENNPQMMLYALGALPLYDWIYDIQTVRMSIVQPRLDNISSFDIDAPALRAWGEETVKPTAQKAFDGVEEYCPGDWCTSGFCRARATCRARCDQFGAIAEFKGVMPPRITNEELGALLQKLQGAKKWIDELEDYAAAELLVGHQVPGFKVVEGRSNRAFKDTDAAFQKIIAAGTPEAMLFERKPLPLSKIEGMLGKTTFAQLLQDEVVKPPGKPTLVPESDKREPYRAACAANEFEGVASDG